MNIKQESRGRISDVPWRYSSSAWHAVMREAPRPGARPVEPTRVAELAAGDSGAPGRRLAARLRGVRQTIHSCAEGHECGRQTARPVPGCVAREAGGQSNGRQSRQVIARMRKRSLAARVRTASAGLRRFPGYSLPASRPGPGGAPSPAAERGRRRRRRAPTCVARLVNGREEGYRRSR